VRLKEVRVSENSSSTTAVTLEYYDPYASPSATYYPIVNNHHIPPDSTSVIFSGVFHVKEDDSLTITPDDIDGSTVNLTVAVTYEVLS